MGIHVDGERLAGVGIHVDARVGNVAECVRVDMGIVKDMRRLVVGIHRLVVGIRTGQMQLRSTPTM